MSKFGSIRDNDLIENRFLCGHKPDYDEEGYYYSQNKFDGEAEIDYRLTEDQLITYESLSSGYKEAFENILEEKYLYNSMNPGKREFATLRDILHNHSNGAFSEEILNDRYASQNFEERLKRAEELYDKGKQISLYVEKEVAYENNEEVYYIKGFDAYFFVKREDIANYLRDFNTSNKSCKVVDYRKIDAIENLMLTQVEYNEMDDTNYRDVIPVSLINYSIRGDGSTLVKQFLKMHYLEHSEYLYSCIKHQELSSDDYGLLVCTPLTEQIYAYNPINSKKGNYVSLYDICHSELSTGMRYYVLIEFSGKEVDEYLDIKELKKIKFINYHLFTEDLKRKRKHMKKQFPLYACYNDSNEYGGIELDPPDDIKNSYARLDIVNSDIDVYFLCGTKFGMLALNVNPKNSYEIEDIDECIFSHENRKKFENNIRSYFEEIDEKTLKIDVIGKIDKANKYDRYNNIGNLAWKYDSAEYYSFYAESIIYKINNELRQKLIDTCNGKYKTNFKETTEDITNIKKQYSIVSMLHDKNNYENYIDIEKFNKVNDEIGETISENEFKENLELFNENFDSDFKAKSITLNGLLNTVMTAQALISFLSLYIAIVSVNLPNNTMGYIIVVVIIQIICLIIAGIVNNKMNN